MSIEARRTANLAVALSVAEVPSDGFASSAVDVANSETSLSI